MSLIVKRHQDEFEYYFDWKADIDRNTLPLSEEEKSKIKNSLTLTDRRLSRRLSLAGDGSKDFNLEFDVKSVKVKSNREVEMINKWREVDRAHEDLEHIREAHLKKLKQFEVESKSQNCQLIEFLPFSRNDGGL